MSAHGCGFPIPFGNDETVICGTYLTLGVVSPILCDACFRAAVPTMPPLCEGCRNETTTRTAPALCDACAAEYAADLVWLDAHRAGDPGSRCTSACGHCGRCGGA